MWTEGSLVIDGVTVRYRVKHFDEPSQYGIDDGRISKLEIRKDDSSGRILANYDRGWDIQPEDETGKTAASFLIKRYN